jgi:hypothetical protein|tara:strand:- start:1867 stop:2391 length:525 start_codon:yes stop_codon:yes gene_type:complete
MFPPRRFGSGTPATTPHVELAFTDTLVATNLASGDDVAERVLSILNETERCTDYRVSFLFTRDVFGRALAEKAHTGLTVVDVVENGKLSGKGRELFDWLQSRGVAVLAVRSRYTMHNKVLIVDGHTVVTGSYNFTALAEEKNDEKMLIVHSRDVADRCTDGFAKICQQVGGGVL